MTTRGLALLAVGVVVCAAIVGFMIPRNQAPAPRLTGDVLPTRLAPTFSLADQHGSRVSLSTVHGRPVVLTFLESKCTEQCPVVAETIRRVLAEIGPSGKRIAVLAVSTDPEGDTAKSVRTFSRAHGLWNRWHYLTGSRSSLARVWRSYYIYAAPKGAPASVRDGHTSATYLIDNQGRERVLMSGALDAGALRRDLRILLGLPPTSAEEMVPAPEEGHIAPDFSLPLAHGGSIRLSSLHGRVVLLNFWATWCTACRSEMPRLASWYRQLHGAGLVILGVDQQEGVNDVLPYARSLHVPYPIALDGSGSTSARYGVVGLPTTFLIDAQGVVENVTPGALDSSYLRDHLTPALAAG